VRSGDAAGEGRLRPRPIAPEKHGPTLPVSPANTRVVPERHARAELSPALPILGRVEARRGESCGSRGSPLVRVGW